MLGIVAGQLTGQSREPVVSAVIPTVLTFIGGLLIYILSSEKVKNQNLLSVSIIAFTFTLLVGTFWGSQLRYEFDVMKHSEQSLLYSEYVSQQIRLEKTKK